MPLLPARAAILLKTFKSDRAALAVIEPHYATRALSAGCVMKVRSAVQSIVMTGSIVQKHLSTFKHILIWVDRN